MMFNMAPWQFAQAGGFGSLPGQYGQGIVGGPQSYSQPNGGPTQFGLPPLVAACLAAQGAFASVLEQFGQQPIGAWPGHQQPGVQLPIGQGQGFGSLPLFSPFVGGYPSQSTLAGPLGQHGFQGISGWPSQQQFFGGLGGSPGAFGQRGPVSGIGSYLPFQAAPQVAYAG